MKNWTKVFAAAGVVCVGFLLIGCGSGSPPPKYKLEAVSGKLTKGGQPLKGVIVTFSPEDEKLPGFTGTTNDEGAFELMGPSGKGAAPGKYKVTLATATSAEMYTANPGGGPPAAADSPVPPEYLSPKTSPKSVEVTSGGKNTFDIDL